ncbi:farnesol dehydrogenase-like [Anoplophora glabripennis]|uniref:farnesol dehydrogenase-like n=1 Tax=Anoplophora glabripennis TaxID=217634 RepID=UPI0008754E81|nr:farnesol dehydrogenase-like [Anoplophora glabripennis]
MNYFFCVITPVIIYVLLNVIIVKMVLSMDRWIGKVAIVTGAGAGMGAAISRALVEHGLQVVGLDNREEKIDDLSQQLIGKKGKLHPVRADLTKEEDILEAFKWVKDNLGPVHILINNAGALKLGNLSDGDTQSWKQMLDVNVLGLCIATREAVKSMKENSADGHIIHINSIAGHKVSNVPCLNIYPATKFAVTALTESLRLELNSVEPKIKITSISPGATKTEILKTDSDHRNNPQPLKGFKILLQAEDIADAVTYVLSTPPHVQIHELTIKPIKEEY